VAAETCRLTIGFDSMSKLGDLKWLAFRNNPASNPICTVSMCGRCRMMSARDGLCNRCIKEDLTSIVGADLANRFMDSVIATCMICGEMDEKES